ncbi:MAG: Hsp20/alpha crystallin family protein [Alphaproteobacteria bacterium]
MFTSFPNVFDTTTMTSPWSSSAWNGFGAPVSGTTCPYHGGLAGFTGTPFAGSFGLGGFPGYGSSIFGTSPYSSMGTSGVYGGISPSLLGGNGVLSGLGQTFGPAFSGFGGTVPGYAGYNTTAGINPASIGSVASAGSIPTASASYTGGLNPTVTSGINGQWVPGLTFPNNIVSGHGSFGANPFLSGLSSLFGGGLNQGVASTLMQSPVLAQSMAGSMIRYTDSGDNIVIELAISGIDRQSIDVVVIGSEIRVQITAGIARSAQNMEVPSFIIPLPLSVDASSISASYESDLLRITAIRQKEITATRRKVKVA